MIKPTGNYMAPEEGFEVKVQSSCMRLRLGTIEAVNCRLMISGLLLIGRMAVFIPE